MIPLVARKGQLGTIMDTALPRFAPRNFASLRCDRWCVVTIHQATVVGGILANVNLDQRQGFQARHELHVKKAVVLVLTPPADSRRAKRVKIDAISVVERAPNMR